MSGNDWDEVVAGVFEGLRASDEYRVRRVVTPLDSTHAWDAATHSVISAIAPTPLRQLSVFEFANRFTGAEIAAMQASSSNGVKKFLFMLPLANAQTIDLNSQVIVNVMVLLVSQGILSQARSDAILS